jgi:hypothetical protein
LHNALLFCKHAAHNASITSARVYICGTALAWYDSLHR